MKFLWLFSVLAVAAPTTAISVYLAGGNRKTTTTSGSTEETGLQSNDKPQSHAIPAAPTAAEQVKTETETSIQNVIYASVDVGAGSTSLNTQLDSYKADLASSKTSLTSSENTHATKVSQKQTELTTAWTTEEQRLADKKSSLEDQINQLTQSNNTLADAVKDIKDDLDTTINTAFA